MNHPTSTPAGPRESSLDTPGDEENHGELRAQNFRPKRPFCKIGKKNPVKGTKWNKKKVNPSVYRHGKRLSHGKRLTQNFHVSYQRYGKKHMEQKPHQKT